MVNFGTYPDGYKGLPTSQNIPGGSEYHPYLDKEHQLFMCEKRKVRIPLITLDFCNFHFTSASRSDDEIHIVAKISSLNLQEVSGLLEGGEEIDHSSKYMPFLGKFGFCCDPSSYD